VKAGAEFAAAAVAADAVGAQLVLGDRPVEITLQRAWDALSWRRRATLLAELARAAAAPLPPELSAEVRTCDRLGRGCGWWDRSRGLLALWSATRWLLHCVTAACLTKPPCACLD
jgi:hypothetical protein